MQKKKICKSHGIPSVVRVILAMKPYQVCSSGNWSFFFKFRRTHVQVQLIHFLVFFPAIPNAAFFFSAISTQERKKGSINHESDVDSDEHDEITSSPLPSTSSQRWIDGRPEIVNKSLCPAISYWLALTTPNGAPASRLVVHRKLLKSGVNVNAKQVCWWHDPIFISLCACLFVFKTDGSDFFPFFPCCVLPTHVVMVDRLLINLLTLLNFALINCFCGLIFCLVCFLFLFW